jgi:FKBP-type peptidyl-prolyl cis-trans isomerase
VRRATALVVAAGLLAITLTGCSSDPNADCSTALKPGAASALVSVSGKFGEKPKVTFPTPVETTTSQRSTIIEGNGEKLQKGQMVEFQYSFLDGTTKQSLGASTYAGSGGPLIAVGAIPIPALNTGLLCATVGSRLAIAIAPKDTSATPSSRSTGSAIAVVDIVKAYLPRADGTPQPSLSGFPTVVLAPTGQPGITIPTGSAPKKVETENLKAGSGATVKKNSSVVLHYTAVGWENKNVALSTWQGGSPDVVTMDTGASAVQQGSALPQSMLKQLVGKKVGSQVGVVTPAQGSTPALVWVVDVLGVR